MSSITDPSGAFFSYAAGRWTDHLGSAPADFSLDDVLDLASPTSARWRAWGLKTGWLKPEAGSSEFATIFDLLTTYGNVSILGQLLDRFAPNGSDGDRKSIVDAAKMFIVEKDRLEHLRTLMNHQSTTKALKTVEVLEWFTFKWKFISRDSDNLKEWTKLITGLFDMLASVTIPSPNRLLTVACAMGCMPIIKKLFERGKVNSAFQKQLLPPADGARFITPLDEVVKNGDVEILRYLCQQHGIEAHASSLNILAYCGSNTKVEITKLLLDKFPCLVSEHGAGKVALFQIIMFGRGSEAMERAKLLLHHTQATPGLVDVDKLLAEAVRSGWPDMCRMLIVDGHADAQAVIKRSSSGRLELKENCLKDRMPFLYHEPDEKVLEAVAGCLSDEVLEGIAAVQETALPERVKRN